MKMLFRIVLFSLFLLSNPLLSEGQNMTDYCQLPSSIGNPTDPNLLFVIDASGSMGWCAYTDETSSWSSCESTAKPYVSTTTYEGYFDPTKSYTLDASGVYVETTPSGTPCVTTCTNWSCKNFRFGSCDSVRGTHGCSSSKYACCTAWQSSGDCGLESGNYLNYKFMRRVDVLRWALTGGKLQSCNNSIQTCDPEVYPNSQLSCTSDGCILLSTDGTTKVKVPWARITGTSGGLLFQLKNLSPKPLIGVMFFDTSGVTKTVYIGDYTGSASYDGVNPYKNTITSINHESPGGSTPTAPALWDAYNYLAQNSAQYGGPQPQTGTGNEWKNPMYRCSDNNSDGNCQGNEFQLVPCAKNFVILMTDGQWNRGGIPVGDYCKIDSDAEAESPDPVVPAYWMHKKGFTNQPAGIESYVESVYTVGLWLGGTGEQSLKNVAMYGSFSRLNTWPGGTTGYPQGTCSNVADCCSGTNCGKGSSCTTLPASSSDWDKDGNGIPDTYFKAEDATQIKEKIVEIILDMLRRVSAGSAVSILASSEGSGANILQAVYYPKKSFGTTEIDWTGEMQNLWYYIDPSLQNTSIREDTNLAGTSGAGILNLADDYVLEFYFDSADNKTKAKRYSTGADGTSKTYVDTVLLEDIKNLWETGTLLFQRNLTTSPRTIYTTINGSAGIDFSTANKATLRSYLQAADDTEAEKIINYIHGTDQTGYRSRTVTVGTATGVWKLGDIVDSTPRMQSSIPANSFHQAPPDGYSDSTYLAYINTSSYLSRGMVYTGANDGMLHAFKLGKLEQTWTGQGANDKAKLTNPNTTTALGSETWTFIPKNCLPYLKYAADPDYCHLYFVDAPNFLVDASIEGDPNDTKTVSSWKTVLIGGMGLGGASRITSDSCTTGGTGTCVKTPITDPSDATKGLGYSSYFALNVTDTSNPSLLWEFSDPALGFSTSGPAIVRIGNGSKNGKWFAVFASGPTGPIDTNYRQFLGKSDQNLKLFVLNLKTGALVRTIDTGISNAFGGSLYNATLDADKGDAASSGNYSDDVFYLGYTKKDTSTSTWTKGGVLRVITKEDADPENWVVSTVIDDIGPVTSAVAKLQDRNNKNLWLYFGSGRFFYRLGAATDDASGQQALYGLKEPCYNDTIAIPPGPTNNIHDTCTSTLTTAVLDDQSSDTPSSTLSSTAMGWYINLAGASGSIGAERVITDPLAAFFGAVFFTTYTPSTDICSVGGNTNIWSVTFDTGNAVGGLQGTAITQVSTGAIQEIAMTTAFTERGSRRTSAITGMPPRGQGLLILVGPKPLRKILHIKER